MLGLRERMNFDLEARLMGETLIQNKLPNPDCEGFEEFIDLNVPIELRDDVVKDSDDYWYDCEVIKKRKKVVKKTGDSNEIFVELPPHLEYLCLRDNMHFTSIVLSSLPERDRVLLV